MDRELDFDFNFDAETFQNEAPTESAPDRPTPDYLNALNPPQREAVLQTEGPLLVLAGAGSGKTKMLTSRIAYLISHLGARPWQILAVTFTNKAAGEMRERVYGILSKQGIQRHEVQGPLDIGTFHAICARILRREADRLPFTEPCVIYDDSDQLSLLKSIVKQMGLDDKIYPAKSFQYAINRLKCDALDPDSHLQKWVEALTVSSLKFGPRIRRP